MTLGASSSTISSVAVSSTVSVAVSVAITGAVTGATSAGAVVSVTGGDIISSKALRVRVYFPFPSSFRYPKSCKSAALPSKSAAFKVIFALGNP